MRSKNRFIVAVEKGHNRWACPRCGYQVLLYFNENDNLLRFPEHINGQGESCSFSYTVIEVVYEAPQKLLV